MVTGSTPGEAMENGANPTSPQTVASFWNGSSRFTTRLLGDSFAAEELSLFWSCSSVG